MVLLLLSFVGGVVGTAVFGARADFGDLQRDVSIDGATDRLVPGRIPFEVLDRLDDSSGGEMTVAIAASSASAALECSFEDANGDDAGWSDSVFDEELLNTRYSDYQVLGTTRLGPGSYEAVCVVAGEPSTSSGASFTVGRTFGVQDATDVLGPLLGILAVVVIAGLMFVVGLILLIVGLVQRSRARKAPPTGPAPPGQYPGGPYPPGSYPSGQYPGPSAPGPGQHLAPPAPPSPDARPADGPPPWGAAPDAPPWPGTAPEAPPVAPEPATDPDRSGDPGASGWTIPPSKQQ
jgi:hypothetical protein